MVGTAGVGGCCDHGGAVGLLTPGKGSSSKPAAHLQVSSCTFIFMCFLVPSVYFTIKHVESNTHEGRLGGAQWGKRLASARVVNRRCRDPAGVELPAQRGAWPPSASALARSPPAFSLSSW